MITFVLLATMWNPQEQSFDVWVMDSGMSGTDCTRAIEETHMLYNSRVILSCEIDDMGVE